MAIEVEKMTYSEDRMQEMKMASWVTQKFNLAKTNRTAKDALDEDCMKAYNKVYDDEGKSDWQSKHSSNFVKATIETIRPIMTDNIPRFQALPRTEKGMKEFDKIQMLLDYIWDKNEMSTKLPKAVLTALQTGTAVLYAPWKKDGKGPNGGYPSIDIVDYKRIFPDPMATSFSDASYIIYANWMDENVVKNMFPDRADEIISMSTLADDELITQPMLTPQANMVLVLEMWLRDKQFIDVEQIDEDGSVKTVKKKKYPKGRVITTLPHSGIVLSDRHNPYIDGKFPFVALKDYDLPHEFWGKGEIEQLLSPQESINILNNAILDNAKHTANTVWILDRNSGIPKGALKNREGLVIRKNPGTEVSRPAPPPMPGYVSNAMETLKLDMETISGVHDVTQGRNVSGITAAQAIMALQEAGQARIRLKVKVMEWALGEVGQMVLSRCKQFMRKDEFIRIIGDGGEVSRERITKDILAEDYDVKVVAGSTMPQNKNAMLDMMIRLSQTPAEDGMPVVDREAIVQFLPMPDKRKMLERFENMKQGAEQQAVEQMNQQLDQVMQVVQQLSSEVEKMAKEHQKYKEDESKRKEFEKGYSAGASGKDLTDEQKYGIIQSDKIIPDEILQDIENLSDEEMQQLLQAFPNLEEILASNQ